jgi:glycosyltransferase involved in cell wall biosynthesis
MKILFETAGTPFYLAHGGAKTQIISTAEALRDIGIEVEYARWWDSSQTGDVIHVFSTPSRAYLTFARKKGIPVVNTTLLTGACNRPNWRLSVQGLMIKSIMGLPRLPLLGAIRSQFRWDCFKACDRNVVGLNAEIEVLKRSYGVPTDHIRMVPLGLSNEFLEAGVASRSCGHLITTGTITERKRSVELAHLAKDTGVPICFVGKPYDPTETYWKHFQNLVDGEYVKYISHTESVGEMIDLLQSSRGFVLYSDHENWCLSAHEAAACGLPLLLPDQRWSRERFGETISYLKKDNKRQNRAALKSFHEMAPTLQPPHMEHYSWKEVAEQLRDVYQDVISHH